MNNDFAFFLDQCPLKELERHKWDLMKEQGYEFKYIALAIQFRINEIQGI